MNQPIRFALKASLLALSTFAVGCDANTSDDLELRAQETEVIFTNDLCVVEKGDLLAPYDEVLVDVVLRCPDKRVRIPQIGIDAHGLFGAFGYDTNVQFFIEHGEQKLGFEWIDELPGDGFTGQATDGTLYRFREQSASYLYNDGLDWVEVPVELPDQFLPSQANFSPNPGFKVHPDAEGQLHAQFETKNWGQSGIYHATLDDDEWSWTEESSWSSTSGNRYLGPDGWDRIVTMRRHGSWNGQPQWLLNIDGAKNLPVGTPGDDVGVLADPPRPKLGGPDDAPIAVLRRLEGTGTLGLLAVVDGDDWTDTPIVDTPVLAASCEEVFAVDVPECPPCHRDDDGVGFDTYQIVRTSGGQLWGVWVRMALDSTYNYDIFQIKEDRWRCEANVTSTPFAEASLVVAELRPDASVGRTLELDLGTVWVDRLPRRKIDATAFGSDIAVLVEVADTEEGDVGRVLRIDTTKIQ